VRRQLSAELAASVRLDSHILSAVGLYKFADFKRFKSRVFHAALTLFPLSRPAHTVQVEFSSTHSA
jgi:hypothetical protein